MDGAGSSSGDVSSTATDEVPLADPELPQPNAWPAMGQTESDAAFVQLFAGLLNRRRFVLSSLPLGGPYGGRGAIFLESTCDNGDGGEDPPLHGDADADAGADDDDDDAYDGFGFSFGAVRASGVAIACLPETTVAEGEAREMSGGQCAVCLEEYAAGDALRTIPCAHGFHERCIFRWLSASRLCPLCRLRRRRTRPPTWRRPMGKGRLTMT